MSDSLEPAANYPAQYESWLTLKNGREVFLRPVRETDEPLILDLFSRLSADSIYLRFLRPLHYLSQEMLHHFTHLNYSSSFALAALVDETERDVERANAIISIARYAYDPDEQMTELAIAVRDDWQHVGLGKPLLKRIVDIGKEHGITRFSGMLVPQNRIIIQILTDLGYTVSYCLKEGIYKVEILV
jgi:GNAT superfamily N-acetyltransferase